MTQEYWTLTWPNGELKVYAKGGTLGGVRIKAADGRIVAPFYEAPWLDKGVTADPEILNNLRSEFACVPFGAGYYPLDKFVDDWAEAARTPVSRVDGEFHESDDLLHGYGITGLWTLVSQTDRSIEIALDYPAGSPVRRLIRTVTIDPDSAAIDFSLTIEARTDFRRPVGAHPNLALPKVAGQLRLIPGKFLFGMVHPVGPEIGVSRGQPGAVFANLSNVPLHDGSSGSFDRLPFTHNTEEIVQLCGIDGTMTFLDQEHDIGYRLTWDAEVWPSILLWISNRGRGYAPWDGANMCVGCEPLAGAFDVGTRVGLAVNPINQRGVPTALTMRSGEVRRIEYRFEVLEKE